MITHDHTDFLGVRIPPDLKAALRAAAREERRDMSDYVRFALEMHLRNKKRGKKAAL